MVYPPVVVAIDGGPKVALTESDLRNYAGLYLKGAGKHSLEGAFPAVAVKEELARDRDYKVVERADYIARTEGNRTFPWRLMAIAATDVDLIENQLVWLLAPECRIKDPSWIKPGKVIREVSLSTEGGKACVDFCVKYGLQFIEYDAGWYGDQGNEKSDARTVSRTNLDLQEVIRYTKERGIGVIVY